MVRQVRSDDSPVGWVRRAAERVEGAVVARPWWLRVHMAIGVITGVLLSLTGATGSALVFGDEIDRVLNPTLLRVLARPERASLDDVLSSIQRAYKGRRVDRIHLPATADVSVEVCFAEGADSSCVYVDPYTGQHLGIRVPARSFRGRLFLFHRRLWAGARGETVVGVAGLMLVPLSLTGLLLWMGNKRPIFRWPLAAAKAAYPRYLDSHRMIGICALPLMLLIATTGTAMIFRPTFEAALNRLSSTPMLPVPSVTVNSAAAVPIEKSLRIVATEVPDATPTYVILPKTPTAPLEIRARMRGEWLPKGRSFIYLNPQTTNIVAIADARRSPAGYRVGNGLYPLHVGLLAGTPTRLLHVAVGLAPAVLCWTGLRMAWSRCVPKRSPSGGRLGL